MQILDFKHKRLDSDESDTWECICVSDIMQVHITLIVIGHCLT